MKPSRVKRTSGKHWISVVIAGAIFLCGVTFLSLYFDKLATAPLIMMLVSVFNFFLFLIFASLLDVARGFELEWTGDSWRIVYFRHFARCETGGRLADIRWIDRIVSQDGGAGRLRIATQEGLIQTRIFPEEWREATPLRQRIVGGLYHPDVCIPDTSDSPTYQFRHWGLAVEDAQFATHVDGASYVLVDESGQYVIVSVDATGQTCRSENRYVRTGDDEVITLTNSDDFPLDLAMHRQAFRKTFATEVVSVPTQSVQAHEKKLRQRILGLRLIHIGRALFAALILASAAFVVWYVLSL